jgi:hypothetical protein
VINKPSRNLIAMGESSTNYTAGTKQKAIEPTEPQSFYPDSEYVDLETSCKEVIHKHQVSHVMK